MTTTPPSVQPNVQASVSDAMARLWAKFLPEIERRIAVLEAASASLAAATLTSGERESAHAEAHKLAGSLGTFGLHRGTELARHVELAMAADPVAVPAQEFSDWVAEIRALVNSRQ